MAETSTIVGVATYSSVYDAQNDQESVLALHKHGDLGHVASAVVNKGVHGDLEIYRYDTTSKHLALTGAIIGGLLGVLVPPLGAAAVSSALIGSMSAGAALEAGALAGVGGIVGHFWRNIPKKDLRELGDMLENCDAALVVAAVDKHRTDLESALHCACSVAVKEVGGGRLEDAFEEAARAAVSADGDTPAAG
ncbi:MAG: hypothetical protein P4L93_12240 [Coriobacteriia bacterium]|nr:hypothetical protein [Coriobacteriia bacterium]